METTKAKLKEILVNDLKLQGIKPEEIGDTEPLFGEGLGLDSIDALELGLAIKKRYSVVIDADDTETRQHFASVANLAKYISANR